MIAQSADAPVRRGGHRCASDKAASFIRFCDSFNLPLVFVVDTPGAMPGRRGGEGRIIKRGGRFFNAIVEADVPKG